MSSPRATRRQFSLSSYYSLLECMHKKEIGWQRRKTLAHATHENRSSGAWVADPHDRSQDTSDGLDARRISSVAFGCKVRRPGGAVQGVSSQRLMGHGDVEQAVEEHKG